MYSMLKVTSQAYDHIEWCYLMKVSMGYYHLHNDVCSRGKYHVICFRLWSLISIKLGDCPSYTYLWFGHVIANTYWEISLVFLSIKWCYLIENTRNRSFYCIMLYSHSDIFIWENITDILPVVSSSTNFCRISCHFLHETHCWCSWSADEWLCRTDCSLPLWYLHTSCQCFFFREIMKWRGWPYIPAQILEEDQSNQLQSQGWQPF